MQALRTVGGRGKGVAITEHSMEFGEKVKSTTSLSPSNPTSDTCPKDLKTGPPRSVCTLMSTTAERWKQPVSVDR
jgi:hypothetical protein